MSGNNYKSLKEQIGKLQTTNESLLKENSELKLMHSVNQDKLRDCFNKLETNDRELITSLTENKKFSRFNQDLQQENLILTKNLRDSETKNHDLYIECKEKQKIITHLQEQLSLHTNQNEAFKAKASHLESQIDDNEQFLHKVKQNEQNLLKTNNEFHQELEYSIKSMLDFYLNLDSNLKILLKNTEKSLEFIVKAQDLLVSKKRKNTETLINIFRDGLFFILESIEDSLFGLNEQMEISAKESTLKDNLERELKNMKREEIFSKNDEKELRREIENLAQSKNLSDKEKEKALNELVKFRNENEIISLEIRSLKAEFEKAKLNLEKYQKANDKLINFSEERVQLHQKQTNSANFFDNFFYKMLAFIENQEIVKILRDIFILEAEINKFKIIKTQLEKNLSELELEYKTKLSSKLGSDPDLLDLRRTIDKKREEFQNILSQIRESNLKKSNLFEELELNSKINLREKTNIERSFESKARSIVKENSFHRNQETQNFLKGSMLIETIPKEKTSHYETYKQMKKTFTADKNQANIWSQTNKTAPTVIFSPTNENNIKLKKMMESDQKKLEEKFGPNKIYGD